MKKIFYQKELFSDSYRWHIFPLIKFLENKQELEKDFVLCDNHEQADIIILPMSWNYYYKTKSLKQIDQYLDLDYFKQKPIYSLIVGDLGNKVPKRFKGFVLRASGDKSKLSNKHLGIPIFIDDPLKKFFNTNDVLKRPYSSIPVIGFCGLANPLRVQTVIDFFKIGAKNILSRVGFSHANPQKLMSTSYFRYNILKHLQKAKNIETNFIIRSQYRAGVKTNKDTHNTTVEFYENMKNSEYVVCMRGAGNFSNRFYETLAMGRIPVLINTDCLLPLEGKIDWKKHVVWVEYAERHSIKEKIVEFHSKLDEESLNNLFECNRKLWLNQLQLLPYFKTLLNEN